MFLVLVLIFSLLGSVGAIIVSSLFLLFPDKIKQLIVPCFISYATGTLLGAAFLGLIPHALEHISATFALATVLGGIIIFFILEKLVIWRHCHNEACEAHGAAGPLILVGDALHNFGDGVAIAAAFLGSIPLGIATSLAVIAHEIPQEAGDFAILLNSGYSRKRAFSYNIISSLTALAGAVITYFVVAQIKVLTPYIMAFSAASFIYIAIADLFPYLHQHVHPSQSIRQLALILAGIGTIALIHFMQ